MPRPRRVIVVPAPPLTAEQEAELQENSRKIAEQSKGTATPGHEAEIRDGPEGMDGSFLIFRMEPF
ncbi:hypothetical protein V8E54_001199 [Elaphomyces granulatus]